MTIVSIKSGADPEVLKVGFSDGSSFFIRRSYLDATFSEAPFHVGILLSDEQESSVRYAGECFRAERVALRLIALREHSCASLEQKLKRRGIRDCVVSSVLDRLVDEGLVDDVRFAEMWIRSRLLRKNEGRRLLVSALRSRGVSREIAEAAATRVVTPEMEITSIEHLLRLEGECPKRDDPYLRARLLKAGFAPSAIREAFDRVD